MRAALRGFLASLLVSDGVRDIGRAFRAARRRVRCAPATVHFFFGADDPYSHLAAQMLEPLAARYRISVAPHIVSPPQDSAAPERQRLFDYALRDAAIVAHRYGLSWPAPAKAPSPTMRAGALACLASGLESGRFSEVAAKVGWALWSGAAVPTAPRAPDETVARLMREGDALRKAFGHYLCGMFYFEGEWYWGVDRLHYLEGRLADLGFDRQPGASMLAPYQRESVAPKISASDATVDLWFSFRSPYSYIALQRVADLAAASGATLRLRYILPMVMRGLPVPLEKRLYIMRDCKREADTVGMSFGRTVDPVGVGVERALAVLHHVVPTGRGIAFAHSALKAAFADGIDLASDDGLAEAARRAGVSDQDVNAALADESWRTTAEENRKALFAAGLWGAPTFCVDGSPAHWGQDRIWALEEDLRAAGK
ncbi:MAG: DsbA family protein [Hyphomicrobiales bacterium]|nr:DsbA family protein [Hyphomicrobiales bacterium]